MKTPAQRFPLVDPFAPVEEQFEHTLSWMRDLTLDLDGHQIEERMRVDAQEYARRMIQARMTARARHERAPRRAPAELGITATSRPLERTYQTVFGDVKVSRLGWRDHRHITLIPGDGELNLPPDRYSFAVRAMVAEHAAVSSFDTALEALARQGVQLPKRQAEELVRRVARDFDEFYDWHQAAANDPETPDALLVMSLDSKGIRVLHAALREATQKAAEADKSRPRGDPMAPRKERTHDRRMAVVAAVWDQAWKIRTADQILDNLLPPAQRTLDPSVSRLPRPTNKRVWSSIVKNMEAVVTSLFDEAERRDPSHRRRWVLLLDGAEEQRKTAEREADRRGIKVTIVMDLLHVLSYLWKAGHALNAKDDVATEAWMKIYVEKVLRRPMTDVAAGLRQSATLRKLTAKSREAVETCARYLSERASWMDYASALASGLPIATGVIEGACRHLVQDRMGITGACWDLPTAEAVLRVRALRVSADWDAYMKFHMQREAFRNHSVAHLVEKAA